MPTTFLDGRWSQYLPTGGFRWITEKEIDNFDPVKYKDDSQKGLILEYPKELHNKYPLAIDFPGGKCNCNIKIRTQLRICNCIAIVKEATQKVLKHVY